MTKPLAIDLFCGLGGWADGFLAEGYDVVGFDNHRHVYGSGDAIQKYPAQLVLQDVLTLSGRQFRDASVIVASPPCQAYSRRAMPFGGLWLEHNRMDDDGGPPGNYRGKDPIFNDLFRACFRIAAESGRPIIVENVKGAQKFVGPAKWHFGSFYLWGDVPALMPVTLGGKKGSKGIATGAAPEGTGNSSWFFGKRADPRDVRAGGILADGTKVPGLNWSTPGKAQGFNVTAVQRYREEQGTKQEGSGAAWFDKGIAKMSSRSDCRKAASAQIAKIPPALAQHIARVFKP